MSVVSDQYAVALFELALESEAIEDVKNGLEAMIDALEQEDSRLFFTHPAIAKKTKKEAINALNVHDLLRDFMYVIIDNQRFLELHNIIKSYKTLIESQNEIMRINVHSGKALDEKRIDQLKAQYEKKYNRQVIIENHVDPSIVGGLRFEFQGVVIDDTVNQGIHQIKSRLTN